MNNKSKRTLIIIVLAYVVVILLFFGSIFYVPAYYNGLQDSYLTDTQEQLDDAFETITDTQKLVAQFDQIIDEYPMELIVFKDGINIYNTMMPVNSAASIHESLDQRVSLSQGNGTFIKNGSTYEVWYNIYQVQVTAFLLNITTLQIILLGIATIILITAVFAFQRLMVQSMTTLKETIGKMEKYQLNEVINAQSDDVINSKIKYFAHGLRENISRTAQKEAELQQAAYINKEQFVNSQLIARAFIHEIKTPVYQMLLENETQLSHLNNNDERAREIAEYNVQHADNLLQSINEMLQVFTSNEQKMVLEKESVDLSKIVSEVRKTFAAQIRERKVLLEIEVPETLTIFSNKAMVKLLIHNILSNAIQYAIPETEIQVNLFLDEQNNAVFECVNTAAENNIARLQGDTEIQSFINKDNKYSSGNGIIMITSLAQTLEAHYQRDIAAEQVTTTIVFIGGDQHD
ncbi:sensor histidine kinase [Culicoidibacter larvae]|uniref:histidine kinase n=1 Tax=Culicoidibacter larvae TaxID=2579976 RepID=A0A5R8QDP9_9FIRM|nr:HAMP domain-containing sensor histidine kinase [Culicoidibacter larvae]TLG73897.1 HAMP domain-containing histidine kinase [Culicoidibacter larvae]